MRQFPVALGIKGQTPNAPKTFPVARRVDDLLPVGARLTHSDKFRDFGGTISSTGAAISSWTEVQYVRLGPEADSCIAAKIREGLARDQFRVLVC